MELELELPEPEPLPLPEPEPELEGFLVAAGRAVGLGVGVTAGSRDTVSGPARVLDEPSTWLLLRMNR